MGSRSLERYPERSGLCGTHEVLGSSIGRRSTGGGLAELGDWVWAVSKRVRGWTHKRRTSGGFGLLRNVFMKARESGAGLIDS